jgi:hypothetical protein
VSVPETHPFPGRWYDTIGVPSTQFKQCHLPVCVYSHVESETAHSLLKADELFLNAGTTREPQIAPQIQAT